MSHESLAMPPRSSSPNVPSSPPHRYWYPLTYFLSLALQPTALIGLDSSLQMPKLQVECAAKPSLFAYPTPVNVEKKEEVSEDRFLEGPLCSDPLPTRAPSALIHSPPLP